jgi:hypothetical protein
MQSCSRVSKTPRRRMETKSQKRREQRSAKRKRNSRPHVACLKTDLVLNRSAHNCDESNRLSTRPHMRRFSPATHAALTSSARPGVASRLARPLRLPSSSMDHRTGHPAGKVVTQASARAASSPSTSGTESLRHTAASLAVSAGQRKGRSADARTRQGLDDAGRLRRPVRRRPGRCCSPAGHRHPIYGGLTAD